MAAPMHKFPCNTCGLVFSKSEVQRAHMRSEWHVGNLRRRMAGENGLAEEEYEAHARIAEGGKEQAHSPFRRTMENVEAKAPEEEEEEEAEVRAVESCLFCPLALASIHDTLEHMSREHGLFVPHVERILDVAAFLGFLNTLVFELHECLYCGAQKGCLGGVRTHMRDKGHAKVRWEEVWDFWEGESGREEERLMTKVSNTEWTLPSGAIVKSRSDKADRPRHAHSRSHYQLKKRAAIASPAATSSADCQLPLRSRNAELSLSSFSDSQIRTLQRTEKRFRSKEASAKTAGRNKMEMAPVLTKYYKTENPVYQAG